MKIFDAHTHVQFPAFDTDRNEVIARAQELGIAIVNVGTDKKTSEAAIELAEKYTEGVYATVGLHPIHTAPSFHDASEGENVPEEKFDSDFYKKIALYEKVLAIGECGLDYFRMAEEKRDTNKEKQYEAFLDQMRLAYEVKKPLMIHCRPAAKEEEGNAYGDLIELIKEKKEFLNPMPGIIHFFVGTEMQAEALLELGFYFTFGGAVTLPQRAGGANFERLIAMMPNDRLLTETDAPYVSPLPFRGKRNEPAYIIHALRRIAEIRNDSFQNIAEITFRNAKTVFGLQK